MNEKKNTTKQQRSGKLKETHAIRTSTHTNTVFISVKIQEDIRQGVDAEEQI